MKRKQNTVFFSILLLIFLACGALWLWTDYLVTHISAEGGERNLREVDFSAGCFDLYGPVEYIPNVLLTPEEFEARRDEIQIGNPAGEDPYSTSRLRVYVPVGTYGLMMWNAELAANIYINGQFMESVGVPVGNAEHSIPGVKLLYFTTDAPDGVIEIVQQASNHVLPGSDSHADILIGRPENIRDIYNQYRGIPTMAMGCFLALALAHLILFSLFRSYKANLWFALFCFGWFLRTGYVNPWILSTLFPLPWGALFRLDCLTYPAGALLLCLSLNALFPGVIQKWFRIALSAACGIFACASLFLGNAALWDTMSYFNAVIFLTAAYLLVRLCMKVRKPNAEQIAVLAGLGIFLFGVLRDILHFEILPAQHVVSELTRHTMAEYALLAFVFFHMAAMFRSTMREIAAAKEAEQRRAMEAESERRLSAMKSEFMGELSHELRMPISAISGFAQYFQELLGDETLDIDELRYGARRVESETERMDRLVSQLLDMSAIEAGRFSIRKERVSVEDLFDRIRRNYFPMMNGGRNRLVVKLDRDIVIYADRERVLQVLLNLVSNSCKYTEDGEITLAAEKENGVVRFSIADTGEGMAPEILAAIFTRYPQMRGGVKGVTGNGLGLFISKKLVEAHGGGIGVESNPGKGTRVWFTIPAEGEDAK